MSGLMIKILIGIGGKLLTETFVSRMVVHSLRAAAKKTTNTVDDQMVQNVADALGIK